jgi:hypothetical protein
MKIFLRFLLIGFMLPVLQVNAQDSLMVRDTIPVDSVVTIVADTIETVKRDTIARERHSPRKAAIRSAILPGLGQVYNKKYWKVPIVYAAIGIPIGTFVYNKQWYDRTRRAARMIATNDTANYQSRVDPQLHVFFSTPNALGSLLNYRNEFRRNMDYSILITLLFWGLNVVDATVDAHLKEFDVSDDLSLKIKPAFITGANTPGISFVVTFK